MPKGQATNKHTLIVELRDHKVSLLDGDLEIRHELTYHSASPIGRAAALLHQLVRADLVVNGEMAMESHEAWEKAQAKNKLYRENQ